MSQNSGSEDLLIKKFRTPDQHYIYSATSNEIAAVDRDVWSAVDLLGTGKNEKEMEECLQEAVESGLWGYKKPEIRVNLKNMEKLRSTFKKGGIEQLILNLTNQCNMRCRYCTFSGNYKYERTHENKHMKIETARKAIDYFFSNNSSSEKRAITFYGGEVLTRFDMMKEVVSYARGIDSEVGISFTTNGTLLTEKVLQYLIHNRIGVNVSLDGDIDMNDRNRVLKDGSGSFKLIMNNLKKAKDMDSDYFRDKISYISVLTPPYELEKVRDFFYRSDFFDSNTDVTTSPVYLQDSFMFEKSDLVEFQSRYDEAVKKMLGIYETALIEGKGDNCKVEKQWFEDLITGIHFREKSPIEDTIAPLGQCLPGSRRLFVSVEGSFYMCERVGEHYCIGDVEQGINFKEVSKFLNEWENYFRSCGSCWAVRLCKKCFMEFHVNGKFDESRRESYCSSALKYYEMLLESYCRVIEQNPDSFDSFKPEHYI